jgi:hypothetical protein
MAKRLFVGILLLVLFGIFLVSVGRWAPVEKALTAVLPSPVVGTVKEPTHPHSVTTPVKSAPTATAKPTVDAVMANPAITMPKASEVLGTIESIEATSDTPLTAVYSRALFGPAWSDVDHNGCDTRNDELKASMTVVTFRPGTHDCVVVTGTLQDKYTGTTIHFVKTDAMKVQIDHMVPLNWAFNNGASTWGASERLAFANDPANLTPVDGRANQQKSDSGPAEWLPSNTVYQCEYVARFVYIVKTYKLTIDDADRAAARRDLTTCK